MVLLEFSLIKIKAPVLPDINHLTSYHKSLLSRVLSSNFVMDKTTHMQTKQLIICSLLSLGLKCATAQEAVLSSGGNATGSNGSVAFSIGQVAYTTYTGSNGSVAQGVQQPYEISITTGIKGTSIQLHMVAFPNPTSDKLELQMDVFNEGTSYVLYNAAGQQLETNKVLSTTTILFMGDYPSALYYLSVIQNNKDIKTFKIIKN